MSASAAAHQHRVSLVIPNFGDTSLIRETLASLDETEPVEVVVVDDASPQPAVARDLETLARRGAIDRLILKDRNEGPARAVNAGLAEATGRYVFTIANDDLLEPAVLGMLADTLDERPDHAFAVGGYRCFGLRELTYVPPPWDPWMVLYRNLWPGSVMVRRDAFLAVGGMHDRTSLEDWDLFMCFAEQNYQGTVLPRVTYRYRIRESGRWHAVRASFAREYRSLRRIHRQLFSRSRELRRASPASPGSKLIHWGRAQILRFMPVALAAAIFRVVDWNRSRVGG